MHGRSDPTLLPLLNRWGHVVAHTTLDSEDLAWASQWTWRLSSNGYAVRSEVRDGKKVTIRLHSELNGTPKGLVTDHVNGDMLDNRRCNLRSATVSQNNANSRDRRRRSNYRGVYWHGQAGKWCAQISMNGRIKHLGLFETQEAAAAAYDLAAMQTRPTFARLNLRRDGQSTGQGVIVDG